MESNENTNLENNDYKKFDVNELIEKTMRDQLETEMEILPSKTKIEDDENNLKVSTCQDLLNYEVQPEYFIVNPLIPERALSSITADSGRGKSLLALIIAYHIATGKKLFDQFETKQSKVLIIDQEMNKNEIVTRLKKIIIEDTPIDYLIDQKVNITDTEDFLNILNIISENKYGVIIFDTFTEIHNKEENDSGAMKEVNNKLLDLIRITGISVIYLHHHKKLQKGERLSQSSSRGSTEIIAKVSSHLLLDSKSYREDANSILEITISQEKARSSQRLSGKIGVKIINDNITNKITWEFLGEISDKTKKIEEAKESIMEAIREENWGLTVKQTENKIPGIGTSNIRAAFRELVSEKKLMVNQQGREKVYSLLVNC